MSVLRPGDRTTTTMANKPNTKSNSALLSNHVPAAAKASRFQATSKPNDRFNITVNESEAKVTSSSIPGHLSAHSARRFSMGGAGAVVSAGVSTGGGVSSGLNGLGAGGVRKEQPLKKSQANNLNKDLNSTVSSTATRSSVSKPSMLSKNNPPPPAPSTHAASNSSVKAASSVPATASLASNRSAAFHTSKVGLARVPK
jgi:hypothetical protein